MNYTILQGDALELLRTLPPESVHTCVTSPPYYNLRDYGVEGQIGNEGSVEEYLQALVAVFREVRRVLHPNGTLWVNVGDSYATNSGNQPPTNTRNSCGHTAKRVPQGYKKKDLIGIPWQLAFALRADGWYLRQDIIWQKPNCMPESVNDRCTRSHEYIFLLSKSAHYYFNAAAKGLLFLLLYVMLDLCWIGAECVFEGIVHESRVDGVVLAWLCLLLVREIEQFERKIRGDGR